VTVPPEKIGIGPSSVPSITIVPVVVAELDRFWGEAFAARGQGFEPLAALSARSNAVGPLCGGAVGEGDLEDNALYCPQTDELVYDDNWFDAAVMGREGGPLTVAMIIAHEYGHAIQRRLEVDAALLLRELQADCFAGSWLATVADSTSTSFTAEPRDLTAPLAGLLGLRDALDMTASGSLTHGTGFDRVRAALDGLDDGVNGCLGYVDDPPTLTAQAWIDAGDARRAGNAALPSLITTATADLDDHYRIAAPALGWPAWVPPTAVAHQVPGTPRTGPLAGAPLGTVRVSDEALPAGCSRPASWCQVDGVVHLDGPELSARYGIGDLAAGVAIADAWAELALIRAGLPVEPSVVRCLTGVWLGTVFPDAQQRPTRTFGLSPGDLDEVAFTVLAEPSGDGLAAMRATLRGFDAGLGGCVASPGASLDPL
jgi:hypothetical protein